jgi:hypothetical protein
MREELDLNIDDIWIIKMRVIEGIAVFFSGFAKVALPIKI